MDRWKGVVVAAALGLVARPARAQEMVTGDGFAVTVPAAFTRCAPAVEQPMSQQLAAQAAALAGADMEPARARVWAYERSGGDVDRAIIVWIPGHPPPADDPGFREGLREGVRNGTGGAAASVVGVDDERLRGGAEGLTVRLAISSPVVARVRMLLLPRDGFLLLVYHFRTGMDSSGDGPVWRSLLDGISTTAGPPSRSSGASPAAVAGRIVGAALALGLVVFLVARRAQRKPAPRGRSPVGGSPGARVRGTGRPRPLDRGGPSRPPPRRPR